MHHGTSTVGPVRAESGNLEGLVEKFDTGPQGAAEAQVPATLRFLISEHRHLNHVCLLSPHPTLDVQSSVNYWGLGGEIL